MLDREYLSYHDGLGYLVPNDLLVTELRPNRVLMVGSCQLENLSYHKKNLSNCECDFVMINNLAVLPTNPPSPPDIYAFQIIQIPIRSIVPDSIWLKSSFLDIEAHESAFANSVTRLEQYFNSFMAWHEQYNLLTFNLGFMLPQENLHGRLMPRYDIRNPVYFIDKLNQHLCKLIAARRNNYYVDVDKISAIFGRKYVQDDSVTWTSHGAFLPFLPEYNDRIEPIPPMQEHLTFKIFEFRDAIWNEIIGMYRTINQIDPVKMVVIDLDDTLWNGLLGEQDSPSIEMIENKAGWAIGFIEALGILKKRGIILAIISKNDNDLVEFYWDKILGGMLSLSDFAIRRINWKSKSENMHEIINSVNLLPKNVLYIDDNPIERAAILCSFPEIRVLNKFHYFWRKILLWAPELQSAIVTTESARKTVMIQSQIQRESIRNELSRSDFLNSLKLKISFTLLESLIDPNFLRTFELLNKTNQFNTTGKRWTSRECEEFFNDGGFFWIFKAADMFSEYGLVGVLAVSKFNIVQFVMSCRVVGLELESAAIALVVRLIRENHPDSAVYGLMEKTPSNFLCRETYKNLGFTMLENLWHLDVNTQLSVPSFIHTSEL